MDDAQSRFHYRIVPIGSAGSGFCIERRGSLWASHPSALYLGALIDALRRGAAEDDALLIARTIYERPDPTLAERMVHFTVTGPWQPSPDPYKLKEVP